MAGSRRPQATAQEAPRRRLRLQPAARSPTARPESAAGAVAADGRSAYTRTAARHSCCKRRRSTEWKNQKVMTAYAAVSYTPKGAPNRRLGTLQIEARHRVSDAEAARRLLEVPHPRGELPDAAGRRQLKTSPAEWTTLTAAQDRVIALDRVLAAVDKSRIIRRTSAGVKADPPPMILQPRPPPAILRVEHRRRSHSCTDQEERPQVRSVNTNLGSLLSTSDEDVLTPATTMRLKATDLKGTWEPAGTLCRRSFKKLPADDTLEGRPGQRPREEGQPTTVFLSTAPAELILLQGAPNYQLVRAPATCCWVSTPRATSSRHGARRVAGLLPGCRVGGSRPPGFTGRGRSRRRTCRRHSSRFPSKHPRSARCWQPSGPRSGGRSGPAGVDSQTARVTAKR